MVSLVIARPLSEFDLYLQNESPGKDKEANWPARALGAIQRESAHLFPEGGSDQWQMETAAGRENSGAAWYGRAVTRS